MQMMASDRPFYKFNEVTSLTGVKPYVLRFWESEFDHICPSFSEDGQKLYSDKDIENIYKIKKLLFEDKLSIPQAKGYMDQGQISNEVQSTDIDELKNILAFESIPVIARESLEVGKIEILPTANITQEEGLLLKAKSLKEALQGLIESNVLEKEAAISKKAQEKEAVTSAIVQWKKNNAFSEQDVVKLVTAKKKLSSLMHKIDSLISH